MKMLNKLLPAMGLASAVLLTGCGGSDASRDTAEAIVGAVAKSSGNSGAVNEMVSQQPEFKAAINCMIGKLDDAGWTQDQHDELMSDTNDTGNLQMINRNKYSDGEFMEKYGALLSIGSCWQG